MTGGVPERVALAYAHQSFTTAVHLEAALRRRCEVVLSGPGHPSASREPDPGLPLLWVESGVGWFPPPSCLTGSSIAYLIDTHRGWRWRAAVASAFRTTFVAQRAAVSTFGSVGVQARWLPLAVPAELCDPGPSLVDRPYDVAMVGQAPPGSTRAAILEALRGRGLVAPAAGWLSPSEMMQVYRSSRVVVNVPLANDLNMRAFEALGARATLVTGPMDGASELLGRLPVVVSNNLDPEGWAAAVHDAVEAGDQGRADAGHRLVTTEHTYDHRADAVLAAFAEERPDGPARAGIERALAEGWARWGDAGEVWRLTRSPLQTTKAIGWRSLSTGKRVIRSKRALRWVQSRS